MDETADQPPRAGRYGYHGHHHRGSTWSDGVHDVADPVCGARIDPHLTEHRVERPGAWHYFCSARCRALFESDPERYGG